MSLAGAKFICLDEAGENGRVIEAKGRKFTVGYYMACDYVLDDNRAMGVHCEIQCDAFGRVIINNLSKQHPVSLNGLPITIKRPLLNGAVIKILDKKFLWKFPRTTSVEYEDVSTNVSTPQKQIGIPEQPPNSCPDFKFHRDLPKRLTVHNFAYCIESDEEGNTSTEVDKIEEPTSSTDAQKNHKDIEQSDLKHEAPDTTTDLTSTKVGRAVTPDIAKSTPLVELEYTPKINLINSTQNKDNTSSQKMQQLLSMCNKSDIVITSFSPRETGVRIEKSFTAIVKAAATTPKSVYGTPKGALYTCNDDDSPNFIDFSTPASSKKSLSRLAKKSSMHLIDLTTPGKLRFETTLAKSAHKNSAVNARLLVEKLGVSALPATPTADDPTTRTPSSAGSVISVDSTDSSSVIEVSESSTPSLETKSKQIIARAATDSVLSKVTTTPKRTPQSLMKRALLTSAKKQQNAATHLRTPQPRLPAIAVCSASRSLLTPTSASARDRLLKRRLSLTTPTRKGTAAAKLKLDALLSSPEGASTSLAAARRSSFSLTPSGGISTHTLPSSTPLGMTTSKLRAGAKTSPLHRVRKFIAVGSESSQISKVRTRISPSRSAQLLAKARRALCSPVKNRRSSVTMSILKTLKSTQQASMIELPKKAVLFADERQEKSAKDELNRTFTLCSDDEVEGGNTQAKLKNQTTSLIESVAVNVTRKDGTLTPTKETKNLEKFDKTFSPIPQKADVEELLEVPVDVCEVKVELQYSSTDLPCVQELYGKDFETKSNGEYSMKQKLSRNMKEAEVISESFGEILEEAILPENVYDAGDVVSKELVQKEFELELSLENNETKGNEVKTNVLQDMLGQLELGEEEGDDLENIDLEKLRKEQKLEMASKNSEANEESRVDKIAGTMVEHLEAKTALVTTKQIRTEPNESAQVVEEPKGIHSVNELKGSNEVDLCYELKEDSPSKTEDIEQKEGFAVELPASNGSIHKKSNSAKLSDEYIFPSGETEDTAELLNEIEYVLNKSDELQLKHLLECEVLHDRADIEVSHENQTEESVVLEAAAEEIAISNDSEDKDKINEGNDYSENKYIEQSSKALETTLESISIDVRDVSKNKKISEEIPSDFKNNSEEKNEPFPNDIDSIFKAIPTDVQDNSDNKSEVELSIAIPSNFTDISDIKNEDQAVDFNSKAIPTKSKDNPDHKNEEKSSESIPTNLKDNSENKIELQFSKAIDSTFESIQNDAQDNSDKKNEVELSEVTTADNTNITVNKNEEKPSNVMYSNYKAIATDSADPAIDVDVRLPLVKQQIENSGNNESETPSFSGLRDAKTPRCTGLHDPKTCQNDKVKVLEGVSSLIETPKHVNVKECKQQEPSSSTNTERHIFTPRRSERRASLSANKGKEKETWSSNKPEQQVCTPRRSARRASMSSDPVDSDNLYTPKRKTRRASLSVEATTMLTPKRRPSMTLDDDAISATPQRKTPRPKRIALIEENAEDIEAIVEEETESDKEADELFRNEMHEALPERSREEGPAITAVNKGVAEINNECNKEVDKLDTGGDEDLFGEININTASSRSDERVPISDEMAKVTTEKAHKDQLKEVSIERKTPLEHKAAEVTSSTNHEEELIVKEVKRVVTNCGEDESTLPVKKGTYVATKLADETKAGLEVRPETSLIEESICEEIEHEEAENYKCIERKEHLDGDKYAVTCLTDKTESAVREIETLEDDYCEIIENSNASSDNVNTVVEFQALQPDESVAENSDESEYNYGREVVDSKDTHVDHIAPANMPSKSEIATPKTAKSIKVETLSPKTPVLVGMRELLKTPKALAGTPEFTGLYELVRTPKSIKPSESTTNDTLDQLTTPVKIPKGEIKALEDVEKAEESEEDEENTTAAAENFIGMREMLKTPKSSSTPLFKGLKELMQTPKICVTPIYGGIKELMNTPVNESLDMHISSSFTENSAIKHNMSANISTCSVACDGGDGDDDVGKFFTTPRAKNVMIPNVPPSAIIQKNSESVEYVNPTECTLNDTSIYKLDDIFKTQIVTGFSENLTDMLEEESVEKIVTETKSPIGDSVEAEELEAAHLSAEESFDKLAGKELTYRPSLRKMYTYKPPTHSVPPSPFSASDGISDLPKTDIQEWVDSLEKVEPLADEFEDSLRRTEEQEVTLGDSMINKSPHDKDPFSISALMPSSSTCDAYNETMGSEAMVNISAVSSAIDPLAASVLKKGIDKIPGIQLLGTVKELKPVRPITTKDHDISGLDFLDQSGEGSVLSEPLVVSDTESNDIQDGQINEEAEVETSGSNELNKVSEDDEKNRCEVDFERRGNDDFEASLLVSETDSLEKTENKVSEEDLKKKSAELLLEKSAELLEEESAELLLEKSGELLEEKSAELLLEKSAELMEEESPELLLEKSGELLEEESAELLLEKSAELLEEESAELLLEKSGELLEEESAELLLEKSAELLEEESAELLLEKSAELLEEESAELLLEKSAELMEEESPELLLEKSAELLEEESAEKLTVGPANALKEENRKLLREESAGALLVESAELLEEKSSENLRKPVDLLEEESTKALTVEPAKGLKEESLEESTDILNEEFTELLNEVSAEALMTKRAELPEEVYARTRRVKTPEVSKEESVKVLTVEPVQLQNKESAEALTVESVKLLEKETAKQLKSESVEVLNDESTDILMVEPLEIRKKESAEVLIAEPLELLEEVSAENTASIAHENEGIASLTKSTGNIQMEIQTEEQFMNEEKEHMLDTEISTAVKLPGLATTPEFEHFKANEIKCQPRSVTPHQHKERSKLSRNTLGAQEDLKITIDFQEEKLKLQTSVKEDLYENVIVNESDTCNIDKTEPTNMNPIYLQQSETEIVSTSTGSSVTNESVNANRVESMGAQQKPSVANDKEELPNDQTHLKTTEHTTEIKSSFISSNQGDKIQIPQKSSVDATVSVAPVPNRRGRGRKGSQSSQCSSNDEDPSTRRILRKHAKTPIKESLEEDVEIAKTKKESSEVFKSIDFEVEITDTIARNEIKDELEENVRESEKTIEGSAEATGEYVAMSTSEDVLIPVVPVRNEGTVSSTDNVEVDIQTHGRATHEKRAGLHKTEMPTVVIKDTEQLFHENPDTKTQRKRTVSETSQGSLKDEVRAKRRAGRRRKVNTIEEDEQKKLEMSETHEVFEKVSQETLQEVLHEEGTHTAKESEFPNDTTGKEPISAYKRVSQEVLDGISHIASKVQQEETSMTKELELPSDKTDTAPKSSQEILDVELKSEDYPEVHEEETHISKESELSSDITKSNEAHITRLKEFETEATREMPKRRSIHRNKTTSESSQYSVSQDNGVPKRRGRRPRHDVNSHEENVSLEVSETAVQPAKDKDSTKVPARGRRHQKNMEEHEAETAVDDTKKTATSRRKRGRKNTVDSVEKLAVKDMSEAADATLEEAEIGLQSETEVPAQPIIQVVPEKSVKTEPKRRAARGRGKIEPAEPKTKHQEEHVADNTDAVEAAATEIKMERKPTVRRRAAQPAVQECQDEVATTSTRRAGLRRHIEGHNADEAAKPHNKEIDHGKSKYPVTADDDIEIAETSKFDEEHVEEEQKEKIAKGRAPSRRGGARKKKEEAEAIKAEKESSNETINTEEERDHLKNADTKPEITELKGRKRKESHTDHEADEHSDEPAKKRATKRAAQAVTEEKTSTPSAVGAAAPRRTRKASALNVDNSTTETVELTVTPQQKSARNQPRRAAAVQPHYYDESSDNEMHHKTQRFQHQIDMSVTDAANTSATRGGRTRKPTAKVQQFLEEERAKTSTPKRRGLLNVEIHASPLKSSARRVRKPSAYNDEALGTPITAPTSNSSTRRARGRALPAEQVAVENHTSVVEHKTADDEPHDSDANDKQHVAIDSTGGHTVSRSHTRGARKAKLEQHAADTTREAEEPPSKKALKLLVAETMSVEVTAEAPQSKKRAARSKRAPTVKAANVEKADSTLVLEEEKPKTTTTRSRAGTRAKAQQDEPQESSESVEAHIEAVVIVEHAAEPEEDEEEDASLMKVAEKVGAKPKRTRRKQPEETVDGAAELGAVSSAKKTARGGRAGRKVVRFEPSDETPNAGATVSAMADAADKAGPATDTKGEADVTAAPPAPKRATRTRRK